MRRLVILAAVAAATLVPSIVSTAPAQAGPVEVKRDDCTGSYNVYVKGNPVLPQPQNVWCPYEDS